MLTGRGRIRRAFVARIVDGSAGSVAIVIRRKDIKMSMMMHLTIVGLADLSVFYTIIAALAEAERGAAKREAEEDDAQLAGAIAELDPFQ
jgi:hypothetical protein